MNPTNLSGSRYRLVSLCMWFDERFRRLSPLKSSGQALWIYLLTGPHTSNIPGLSSVGRGALIEQLGWSARDFDAAFTEIQQAGLAQADWKSRVVWVPNCIKYNPPKNPNVVKSWQQTWGLISECQLKNQAHSRLHQYLESISKSFAEAFLIACPKSCEKLSQSPPESFLKSFAEASEKALANQDQEQEQDKKEEKNKNPPGPPRRVGLPQKIAQHEDSFAVFWKLFPRKTDRKLSLATWARLTNGDRQKALEALPLHVAWWKRSQTPPSKIKCASGWLNGRRWEDELPADESVHGPGEGWDEVDQIIQQRRHAQQQGEAT